MAARKTVYRTWMVELGKGNDKGRDKDHDKAVTRICDKDRDRGGDKGRDKDSDKGKGCDKKDSASPPAKSLEDLPCNTRRRNFEGTHIRVKSFIFCIFYCFRLSSNWRFL